MSKLIIHSPAGDRQVTELCAGELLTLGRAVDNTIRLDDNMASRHHARLTVGEDGTCQIEDLHSANGTTLNGSPLVVPEVLQDGDRLRFASVTAVYLAAETDAAQLPVLEPSVGETFAGLYRLESSLGETSEYHNFLAAARAENSEWVSLKIFHSDVLAQDGSFERAAGEFARLQAAPGHSSLIPLLDFGRWRGTSYLAAEWIDGYPLLDLLRRRKALPLPEALQLARPAAAVADHACAHGLCGPDLAPRAVLLSFDAHPPADAWEQMLGLSLERWPAFSLKMTPRLFTPVTSEPAPMLWPLGALLCELLGHPALTPGVLRPPRIASLGEAGNVTLARGVESAGKAFGSDVGFIDALAGAAGIAVPGARSLA